MSDKHLADSAEPPITTRSSCTMVPGSVKFGSIARRVARCANKLCPQRGGADLSCAIVAPPGSATMTRGTRRRRRVRPGGVRRPPQGMDPQRIPKTPATRWLQPPGQDAVLFRFFCQPKTSFQLVETSDYCKFCTERFYFWTPRPIGMHELVIVK